MHSTIQLGSVALPAGPLTSLLAVWLATEVAARLGRRYGITYDRMFGLCTSALLAGLVVARLAHVIAFWEVYSQSLLDILALRPGGLTPWPGILGAFAAGWLYLMRFRLDPEPAGAALLTGLVAGGVVWTIGGYLTGRVVGTETSMVWAAMYGEQARHPTGLYQSLGCAAIWALLWYRTLDPRRVLLTGLFLVALLFLATEGFRIGRSDALWLDGIQIGWLGLALLTGYALWRTNLSSNTAPPASDAGSS